MEKLYYNAIVEILRNGILNEEVISIQKKMIELSKMHDVNAMKILYLLIRLQPSIVRENKAYLITNLDYQDEYDKSTICINLANNTVKAAYRLLYTILVSFYIDPSIKDINESTLYGYLMAHLADIYKADNNFHSMVGLEKVMVASSKTIAMLYPFDTKVECYQNKNGNMKNYEDLLHDYYRKHPYFLKRATKEHPKMRKILKNMKKQEVYVPCADDTTLIRDIKTFNNDSRFSKIKRYNYSTLQFVNKNF